MPDFDMNTIEGDAGVARFHIGDETIEVDIVLATQQSGIIAVNVREEFPTEGITNPDHLARLEAESGNKFLVQWRSYLKEETGKTVSGHIAMAIYDKITEAYAELKKNNSAGFESLSTQDWISEGPPNKSESSSTTASTQS